VYFPIHDIWHDGSEGLPLFTMHNQEKWLQPTGFYRAAMELRNQGIPCDFVSDRLLVQVKVNEKRIEAGDVSAKLLVIPETTHMPLDTARRLVDLAKAGATIVFLGKLPTDVPGNSDLVNRKEQLATIFAEAKGEGVIPIPRGSFVVPGNPKHVLAALGGHPEPLAERGLRFIRRKQADGWSYFVVNTTGRDFLDDITFSTPLKSSVLLDPMSGRSGVAPPGQAIRLKLSPGESRIIRTYTHKQQAEGPRWSDFDPAANPIELTGNWKVSFLDGGPIVPPSYGTSSLGSWTDQKDDAYRNFSGTAVYRLEFDRKEKSPAILDLGEIANTAKVRLNGKDAGTCWAPPHRLDVSDLLVTGKNVLEVEVTNLAANRIADLDRRKVQWKAFHEINFVNIDYKNFDASGWKPLPSGLLGPVKLIPVKAP
jgi:hypothetical protein